MTTATVKIWGITLGYVEMNEDEVFARFEYDPDFVDLGWEVAPIHMPLKKDFVYIFENLAKETFKGLPGLLADSLPDRYGNKLIEVWLASQGRKPDDFNAIERLCYTGSRGMGALEYVPSISSEDTNQPLEIKNLVKLASEVLNSKEELSTTFENSENNEAIMQIISVGVSAGGARAKAVIAYNAKTEEVRSGQLNQPEDFEHWLIKFDGVVNNGDWGVTDPAGFGLLEYSYYLMARECNISIMESRLLTEGGRSHFMTKRFDRDNKGGKAFTQTLGAVAHFDYYFSGAYSYEQVFMTMRELNLEQKELEEQFKRMVFNFVSCNQDDHVKNISFMMEEGKWYLSPAYDLCHAEGSEFTKNHQLSLNGKTNDFTLADLKYAEEYAGLPNGRAKIILQETIEAFKQWNKLAIDLDIPAQLRGHVNSTLRLEWS